MATEPRREPAAILWIATGAALAAWFLCLRHVWSKSIFMDDAFIYLQIAKNILLQGTAQYFPIAECAALLASSPIKLLLLVPSLALGWLLAPLPSLEAARWAFLFSGLLTGFMFLPLCRPLKYWLYGMTLSGVFFLTTESGMQMEGLLLFWTFWCFLVRRFHPERKQDLAGPADVWLLCILALARIEYALVPAVWYAWLLISRIRRKEPLLPLLLPPVILGLGWVLIAFALDVWPIPTTYLSKVLTGKLKLFSENFLQLLPRFTRDYFFGDEGRWVWLSAPAFCLLASLSFRPAHARRILSGGGGLVLLTLAGVLVLLYQAPGSFLWYYENFFIVFLTLAAAVALGPWPSGDLPGWLWRAGAAGLLLLFLFLNAFGQYEGFEWDFDDPGSRAPAYISIAGHHDSAGVYVFPGLPPMRLRMMEIGIVAYFGDSDAWIYDLGGLAQVRNLEGVDESLLSRFYPASALCSGEDIRRRLDGHIGAALPLRTIWRIPPEDAWKVQDYLPELHLGIN